MSLSRKLRIGFLLVTACSLSAPAQVQPMPAESSLERGLWPAPNRQYFPAGVFDSSPVRDNSTADWYAHTLASLAETSLFDLRNRNRSDKDKDNDKAIQAYRFLWLPSLHRPISVRLTINSDGTGTVVTRTIDLHSGSTVKKGVTKLVNESGEPILDMPNPATKAEVQEVLKQLQSLGFWSLKTEAVASADEDAQGRHYTHLATDGARWLLEGVKNSDYHVVDRWSPEYPGNNVPANQEYAKLCRYLLRLGKVDKGKDIY